MSGMKTYLNFIVKHIEQYTPKESVKKLKQSKNIKIVSYKNIPEINDNIVEFLRYNKIKKQQCYDNSYAVVTSFLFDKVSYVEGLVSVHGVPIWHAWNCYNNKYHFDLTAEIALNNDALMDGYLQVLNFNASQVNEYAHKTMTTGSFINEYYGVHIV